MTYRAWLQTQMQDGYRPELTPNRAEYERWLDTIRYRNADFRLLYRGSKHVLLEIRMERAMSPGTDISSLHLREGDIFTVDSYHNIPLGMTYDEFIERVFLGIVYAEEHEAAEFFMVDGDQRFHPHRPGFESRVQIPQRLRAS